MSVVPINQARDNGIAPRHKKPRPKSARVVRVLEQPTDDTDFWGAIEIAVGQDVARYLVRFIPSDFGEGAVGFEVERLTADLTAAGETYHVHLSDNPADRSCDCLGCLRHGHCKHVEGLDALCRSGRLPVLAYRSAGDFAANEPEAFDRHAAAIAGTFTDNPRELTYGDPWDGPDAAA